MYILNKMLVNRIPDLLGEGCAFTDMCSHAYKHTHAQRFNIEFQHLKFIHSTQANIYFYCTVSLYRLLVPPSLGPYLVGNIRVSE